MYKLLTAVLFFISFNSKLAIAQDKNNTIDKSGIIDGHDKISSSFVVDPDPIEPLPVKKENIKDGDEIILEDIRQVIDSKGKKNNNEIKDISANKTISDNLKKINVKKTSIKKTSIKKISKIKNKKKKSIKENSENLNSDEADFNFEQKLHSSYEKFSINPTSTDIWGKASAGQKENIYTVQKNDTLFTISKTLFGDSKFWPKVWALNRSSILNPHQIIPGMKIHFFSGDAENLPALSMKSIDKDDKYLVQDTEFSKLTTIHGNQTDKDNYPTAIPDSFPLSKNGKYYNSKNSESIQIDLKNFEYNEQENYKNPYILTSSELVSDFTVPIDQIQNLVCKDNQFIPLVIKNNSTATIGQYLIVEKLQKTANRLKTTLKYKTVGTVAINDKNQMRVSDCKQLMDRDTLIVSSEKIQNLSEPNEIFNRPAEIVDGLDYQSQEMYASNQYLIINIDGLNVDNGANLNIFSDDLGKNVGTIRILRRTGTVAIAVVTHVFDAINRGDKIIE